MKRTSLEELKNEFKNRRTAFTGAEIEELALIGYITLKDYKKHTTATVEGEAQ